MLEKLKSIKNNSLLKQIFDIGNVGLYAFLAVALAVSWSSIGIIQKNYDLQKDITVSEQKVAILQQEVENQKLDNEYYKTDAFLEIAARRLLTRAAPGEKLIIVPKSVAATYISPPEETPQSKETAKKDQTANWRAWFDFFLGKPSSS